MPETTKQPDRAIGAEEDFGALFERSLKQPKQGEVVTGRVVLIGRDAVTIDIGYKSEGTIPIHEFTTREGGLTVQEGDEIDVYFEASDTDTGEIILSRQKAEQFKVWRQIEKAFERDGAVEGTIVGKVKGGLKVDIGVAAFLPGSHADLRPTRNLDRYIGQRGRFAILKFNRSRGNVVVSRRSVLERERTALKSETLKVLEEGVILEGTVKNITDYGAFVDLGGIDGLLHVTDMSWGRVGHPSEVINVGDRVKVVVLKYDPERERVSLGMKQIMPDPWTTIAERLPINARIRGKVVSLTDYGAFVEIERGIDVDNERISLGIKQLTEDPWAQVPKRYAPGTRVKGAVTSITDFGVFVELEEGIEGLVHVSQISTERVDKPSALYKPGDAVEAEVTSVDSREKRIGLSIKALRKSEERADMETYLARERDSGRFSLADVMPEAEKQKG